MWRESLFPLRCEAAPKPDSSFLPNIAHAANYDDCVAERLNAVLKDLDHIAYIRLTDHAGHDINTVTNIARILVQDVRDVFRGIERRGIESAS